MTLKNLADLVRLKLNYNSQDAPVKVDERVIIAMADTALSGLLPKYIQAYGADVIGMMAIRQYFDVKYDSQADLKYIDTEGKVNGVAGNMGMISVGLTQDDECDFVLIKPADLSIYKRLEAGQGGAVRFWQEGERIYFKQLPFAVTEVVVKAIPNLSKLDFDKGVPMPADLQDMVIETICERIRGQKAEDKPNDNNDNQTTVN